MKDGYSCYYLCLVGVLPNELYCKSAGGCENCKFYLEDPNPGKEFAEKSEDEEISEVERENDRYNQEQDWLENHGRELE